MDSVTIPAPCGTGGHDARIHQQGTRWAPLLVAAALGCSFESACERCTFFETAPQFIPILKRQRDHAADHDQADRIVLFEKLIADVDGIGWLCFDGPRALDRGPPG